MYLLEATFHTWKKYMHTELANLSYPAESSFEINQSFHVLMNIIWHSPWWSQYLSEGRGFESHPSNMPVIFFHRTRGGGGEYWGKSAKPQRFRGKKKKKKYFFSPTGPPLPPPPPIYNPAITRRTFFAAFLRQTELKHHCTANILHFIYQGQWLL